MAYMSFCILFQSIINLYLVMIPWFLYRLGVGTWISLGFPTISKKGDVGRCEMQAECGSCSGWCSWCRGSWHEQDVARCCRKSSLKNCMKYGISTVWSLKVWLFAFWWSNWDFHTVFSVPNDSLELFILLPSEVHEVNVSEAGDHLYS